VTFTKVLTIYHRVEIGLYPPTDLQKDPIAGVSRGYDTLERFRGRYSYKCELPICVFSQSKLWTSKELHTYWDQTGHHSLDGKNC
jgi:hypothetical protein